MIVFVHGVPETADLWRDVRAAIDRESVAVQLPGFGCPRPDGFTATKDAYVDWLVGAIDALDGPVDLVGHDWGAGLTYRVATAFGDRLRSWAADVGAIAHPDYTWHDFAKIWQTPGEGEAFVEGQLAQSVEAQSAMYEGFGVPGGHARTMAEAYDATMGAAILDLYRSATPNPHAAWGPWRPTSAPGLVLHPTDDPFDDRAHATAVAEALGAGFAPMEGAGHFWPAQAPEAGAAVLETFWSSFD